MRRGTTPMHTFKVDIGLDNIVALYVTYVQNGEEVLEKTLDDVTLDSETKTIKVQLTQEDTLRFESGSWDRWARNEARDNKVRIQIRLKYADGRAPASNIIITTVDEILKEGEI